MSEFKHLLFLSHSGADTEAARLLVKRIESSHYAKEHQIRVWFDKRDLRPGIKWRSQLEEAIVNRSTAFAVYVGSQGIINWVENEVDLGLSKATGNKTLYPFIPILADQLKGIQALPPFTRQFHAVRNVENDDEQFEALLLAITGEKKRNKIPITDEPFLGLRSFKASDSHLFFGRKYPTTITRSNGTTFESNLGDIGELLCRLEEHRLLMVYGDSGSGKSSLIKAGLIPNYLGGKLADTSLNEPDDTVWFVIETRPLRDPYDQLADSLVRIVSNVESSAQDEFAIRDRVTSGKRQGNTPPKPAKILDALKHVSPDKTRLLLVVDQFEELFTQVKDPVLSEDFIALLVYLANDVSDLNVRIVLTMRRDYYNLCAKYEQLYSLTQNNKYLVRRMKNEQLRECIIQPLALAGVEDAEVFTQTVLRDVGDRPGDLALMEMALSDTWRNRESYDNDLLSAYQALGEVTGVLANRANAIYEKLNIEEQSLCAGIFVRLVQPGKTGGATRRTAYRNEFNDLQWQLIQKFASAELGRLIVVGGDNEPNLYAELTHEALYYQWEQYQVWLQDLAEYKSILDKVTERVNLWQETSCESRERYLLTGYELGQAQELLDNHAALLSEQESSLITLSINKKNDAENELSNLKQKQIDDAYRAAKNSKRVSKILGVGLLCSAIFIGVIIQFYLSQKKENIRNQAAIVLGKFDEKTEVNASELQLLFQARNESAEFHKAIFYQAVNSHPKQFLAHQQELMNALVGFNREKGVNVFKQACDDVFLDDVDRISLEPNLICIFMAAKLRMNTDELSVLPARIVAAMSVAIDLRMNLGNPSDLLEFFVDEPSNDMERFVYLAEILNNLGDSVDMKLTTHAAQHMVRFMTIHSEEYQLEYLTPGLISLVKGVKEEYAKDLAQHIIDVMTENTDGYLHNYLSIGLNSLANNVEAEHTNDLGQHFVDAMVDATDRYVLRDLSIGFSHLGDSIDSKLAAQGAQLIVDFMVDNISRPGQDIAPFFEGLNGLISNVEANYVGSLAQRIVDLMAEEATSGYQVVDLSAGLNSLISDLEGESAADLAQHIVDVMADTTSSTKLKYLSLGLKTLGSNVDKTLSAEAAKRIVDAMEGTTKAGNILRLSRGFSGLGNNVDVDLNAAAQHILDLITEVVDGEQLRSLSESLSNLGSNVEVTLTAKAAQRLAGLMEGEDTDVYEFNHLFEGFSFLASNVDIKMTQQVAQRIVDLMAHPSAKDNPMILPAALSELGNRVDTSFATQVAQRLVDAIPKTDVHSIEYLFRGLGDLRGNIGTEDFTRLTKRIFKIIADVKDVDRLPYLTEGLSHLGASIDSKMTTQAAQHIVDLMAEMREHQLYYLSRALISLGEDIEAKYATELAQRIVNLMVEVTDEEKLHRLTNALNSLANNENSKLTVEATEHIIDGMLGNKDWDLTHNLFEDINSLINNVEAEYATSLAPRVVSLMVNTSARGHSNHTLSAGLNSLLSNVDYSQTIDLAQSIVNLMAETTDEGELDSLSIVFSSFKKEADKNLIDTLITAISLPHLSRSAQQNLIKAIGNLTSNNFNGNFWELVYWAKENDYQKLILSGRKP